MNTEFVERCKKARLELREIVAKLLRAKPVVDIQELSRVLGKIEGVSLALGYYEETNREALESYKSLISD